MASLYELLTSLSLTPGVFFYKETGMEADDLMAKLFFTLDWQISKIYTGDNDLLQLVADGAFISREMKNGQFQQVPSVYMLEKFGVSEQQLLYYRALVGDTFDEIAPIFPRLNKELARKLASQLASGLSLSAAVQQTEMSDTVRSRFYG